MTVGICTDSNAQLPPDLAERYGVAVVPITVHVGDCEYLEGVDLGVDEFYAQLREDAVDVTTSHPSPGQFALAYDELAERGCTQILSIHASADSSGTLNAARLAAHSSPVPVRLVDSGTRSFGVSCCVWAAAEAIESGASLDAASSIAEALAPRIGSVFIVGALELVGSVRDPNSAAARFERSVSDTSRFGLADEGIAVLSFRDGEVTIVDRVATAADAVNSMSALAVRWGDRLRVAVGTADFAATPLSDALAAAVGEAGSVAEVIRYRIGPSVGAYTGPGTVGCFMFPTAL
jgi:fatty acid-binding protein DegV